LDEHEDIFAGTKKMILNSLLDGPKTVGEIADKLRIQKGAIRIHLESLQIRQLVTSHFRSERFGRPTKVYTITEKGRELFPRKYDMILSLLIQKVEEKEGHEYVKKIIKSIADNIASDIRDKIKKSDSLDDLEKSLNIVNSFLNELGFMSSLYKEDEIGTYSITSRNCCVHKVALGNQDVICNGFHSRMIEKALDGKVKPDVQLKECIALGDNYSRHIISPQ
jgi:DeoR family transcriptional regulator, suf operon transcriptional repressor